MRIPLKRRLTWLAILALQSSVFLAPTAWAASPAECIRTRLASLSEPVVSLEKLSQEIGARRARVPEFQFIRDEAQRRGLRVWLFGGTAAGYAHYVKWDVLRELGDTRFQPNRFDYDYTNIYRSTQDLDIVVDGSSRQAQEFEQALKTQFPYFLGSKAAGWEVRSIKESSGDKGGLLGDFGFMNQHTDSNSTGMVELTDPPRGESVVRDIRDWDRANGAKFLKDVRESRLTFYYSPKHFKTPRAKSGKNPPIFSVIRALTKAFQYDLKIRDEDLAIIRKEINDFDSKRDLANPDAARWIEKNGKKLFQHAVDIEYAWNTLEKLGLRKKLIAIQKDPKTEDTLSWWMSKKPLQSNPVGKGSGKTAKSLGISIVAHETKDFQAYESMTRSHTGAPNVFESRRGAAGEAAAYGEGFYTAVGKAGAKGTGITIRFEVDPDAREGTDFFRGAHGRGKAGDGDYIVWKNRNAIRVIPETLDMSPVGYFEFLAQGKTLNHAIGQEDQALLWKLKRKLDHRVTSGLVPLEEMEEIRAIVLAQIKSGGENRDLLVQEWLKLEGARLKKDPKETDQLILALKNYQADPVPLFSGLTELSRQTGLQNYVTKKWLPSILKTLKTDLGDRTLENILFSDDPLLQKFGAQALAEREAKNPTPFVMALKSIRSREGDVAAWLKSKAETAEQTREKAAYLALHPELRSAVAKADLKAVDRALEKASNLPLFEKLAGGRLPEKIKSESFEFTSFDFPAGGKRITLGSPKNEPGRWITDREDLRQTTLTEPFEMQATPVTQLQWAIVMGKNPSYFKTDGRMIKINGKNIRMNPDRPVEEVSWNDVRKFVKKLNARDPNYNYRLPTEAEWEYAARAGTNTPYSYGSDPGEMGAYGWHRENSDNRTHDVASLKPNANGLYDIHGNVMEWTRDIYDDSPQPFPLPPIPDSKQRRTKRGGSWATPTNNLRSAARHPGYPGNREADLGFRLVRIPK
jgi:formylglycine-generating enzyme required for sulfatase activity